MFLFLFLINLVSAQVVFDYQLYTNSLGNEYNRVNFPTSENQTVFKVNGNCSFGPLLTTGDSWSEFDVQYLPRTDVSIEKYFGKGEIHPFVALQTSAEVNVGVMPREPLIQAQNVVTGLSIGELDQFRVSMAVMNGIGFHSKQSATGIMASAGVSKEKFGLATSLVMEDITSAVSASKLSVGTYFAKNQTRYILEYDKQFDKVLGPAEMSVGIRHAREWNERDVFLFSSFALGTNSVPGSAPRINIGVTFSLQKNKTKKVVAEEIEEDVLDSKDELLDLSGIPIEENQKEDTEEPVVIIDSSDEQTSDQITIDISPNSEPEPKPEPKINQKSSSTFSQTVQNPTQPKSKSPPSDIGILDKQKGRYSKISKSKIESQTPENEMPENNTETVTAHEVQPSTVTPESLNTVAQQAGGDSNLAMLLAILAVVGGGAAWKFYTQYSEQKHEQKMKQLELDAKAAGLAGASPPPCQTAQAEMKAEIESLKTKVNGTAALLEDVDLDFYARKIKKLDKRLKKVRRP